MTIAVSAAVNFKRLEDLLRLAADSGASQNERELAVKEALRLVQARNNTDEPWVPRIMMRFVDCSKCAEKIKPMQRAFSRGAEYLHAECWSHE